MWRICRVGKCIVVPVTAVSFAGVCVEAKAAEALPYGDTTWQGLNWGIGVAADFDVAGKRVSKVTLDNANIVRVTDTSGNVGVSFVLEAHYFLRDFIWHSNDIGIGPFVAIEVGGGATATPSNDLLTKKEPRYGIMLLSSFSF